MLRPKLGVREKEGKGTNDYNKEEAKNVVASPLSFVVPIW